MNRKKLLGYSILISFVSFLAMAILMKTEFRVLFELSHYVGLSSTLLVIGVMFFNSFKGD